MSLKDLLTAEEVQSLLTPEAENGAAASTYSERILRLEVMELRQQTARLEQTIQALIERIERLEGRIPAEERSQGEAVEVQSPAEETPPPETRPLGSRLERYGRKKNRRFP